MNGSSRAIYKGPVGCCCFAGGGIVLVRIYIFHGKRKYRCESLGSLRYFLHGLVERVGDIVQVVTWCRRIKKWRGNCPSLNGVLTLFLEDKMTKDPWLFWRGGWKLEMGIPGKSEVFPARSS